MSSAPVWRSTSVAELPREFVARSCVGYMEREPGRLQLRYVLRGDEHVDDLLVAEDDETVVVFAMISTVGPR